MNKTSKLINPDRTKWGKGGHVPDERVVKLDIKVMEFDVYAGVNQPDWKWLHSGNYYLVDGPIYHSCDGEGSGVREFLIGRWRSRQKAFDKALAATMLDEARDAFDETMLCAYNGWLMELTDQGEDTDKIPEDIDRERAEELWDDLNDLANDLPDDPTLKHALSRAMDAIQPTQSAD